MTQPKPDLEIALTLLAGGATTIAFVGVFDPELEAGGEVVALGAAALVALAVAPWWPPAALLAAGANVAMIVRVWWWPADYGPMNLGLAVYDPPGWRLEFMGWAVSVVLVANLLGAILALAAGPLWREQWREHRLREDGLAGRRIDWLFYTAWGVVGVGVLATVAQVILSYAVFT